MMEDILYDRKGVAADDLDNLAYVAIRCWDSLGAVFDSSKEKCRCDRSLCEYKELAREVGFSKSDPLTEQGRARWGKFRNMVQEFFKAPTSRRIKDGKNRICEVQAE